MQFGVMKEIMPHVRFENKDYGRDEEASRKSGRHIPRHATFVIITSHGSKDSSEHLVEEWLPRKRMEASRGVYNLDWVERIEKMYAAWKEGNELPREGTPIMTWQMGSSEQRSRLRAMGFQVVEDLAAVPDTGLAEIGLDARYLRDLARAWIAEGQQKGINAQELAEAKAKLSEQAAVIARLTERLERLESEREEPVKRGPGRPRKEAEAA